MLRGARAARRGEARSSTAIPCAGAAAHRSSSASSTTGSSRPRDPAADARRERDGRVDAAAVQEADGRLASQHGRLEHLPPPLLRAAAAVLRVRVRAAERDRVARGARGAGRLGSRAARGASPAVDRRGCRSAATSAESRGRADPGGRGRLARRRDRPLLDARLAEPGVGYGRLRDRGVRKGSDGADLPDHAYWEKWFPADWVSEMREQIRLWFYSQLFMSVVLASARRSDASSGTRSARRDRPRDAKSWGNTIEARRRVRADGSGRDALAVLLAEPPRTKPPLRLRAGGGDQARASSPSGTRSSSSSITRTPWASGRPGRR